MKTISTHRVYPKEYTQLNIVSDWYSCKKEWRPVICADGLAEWWQLPYSDEELIERNQILKIVVSNYPEPFSYKCKKGRFAYFHIQSEEDQKWYTYDTYAILNEMIELLAPRTGDVFYLGVELDS